MLRHQVAFRLLPSSLSALVVGVDCLAACREELIKRSVPFESIGVTGASEVRFKEALVSLALLSACHGLRWAVCVLSLRATCS